ncbi:unnamed protein product [Lactuca saligna]|uniref:Uncharacterized protein n=1 Tax=Lactuca saligna TaxID=75948 RepID=A0AA35ZHS3_LACSI|nr:unnamed protein product [Lactuca saligna]
MSLVFPDGRHIVRPTIRTTTNVQPILLLLPRHVSSITTAKQQHSRYTGALAHHGTNGIELTAKSTNACIPHTCSVLAANAGVQPRILLPIRSRICRPLSHVAGNGQWSTCISTHGTA